MLGKELCGIRRGISFTANLRTELMTNRRPQKIFAGALCVLFALVAFAIVSLAESPSRAPSTARKIGVLASQTSFAAAYGKAVVMGAELAAEEITKRGTPIALVIEDDISDPKSVVSAYNKLAHVDHVDAIVGGTWWLDSVVKLAERGGVPLISCETLMEKGTVSSSKRFIMQGDLRNWVRVFEPVIREHGWTRGAAIRFTSSFGATLADEMRNIFSRDGRTFVGEFEYTDVQGEQANTLVLQLKRSNADVVYIDGQPSGVATILRRMKEQGLNTRGILTNNLISESVAQGLVKPADFPNLFYNTRSSFDSEFKSRFKAKFKEDPKLQADLGYYSVYLLAEALKDKDPIGRLRSGMQVDGIPFVFNSDGVLQSIKQEANHLK
jgi:ABC-type branched-subunit amino acid transport system substrate-binding protein